MIDKKHVIDEIDPEHLVEIIEEQLERKMYWNEGDDPPPWKPPQRKAALENYRLAMIDFAEWHLSRLPDPDFTPDAGRQRLTEWYKNHGPEIVAAEHGDIEPLRKKLPHLAKFLHIPKGPVGKRKTGGYPLSSSAQFAADMVAEVKALWRRVYGKDVRRFKPPAKEIVADIFGVEVRHVELALNQNKKKRPESEKSPGARRNKPRKNKKQKR